MDTGLFSYRVARASLSDLRTELDKRAAVHDDSAAKLARIELHLAQGHEHYHRRRYQEALGDYLRAEGLMYSLVQPGFDPLTTVGDDVRLPMDPELFDPLAETVLATLRIEPDLLREVVPGPSEPFEVAPELALYAEIGQDPVVLSASLDDSVIAAVRSGTDAVRDRDFERAVPLLEEALTAVPEDSPMLRAELAHDLGVALAAVGRPDEAITFVDEARKLFADIGDPVAVELAEGTVSALGGASTRLLRLATGVDEARLPQIVAIPLAQAGAHKVLKREVYAKRLRATRPEQLGVGVGVSVLPGFFPAHVPHHYFFTVQLCLGDTYRQLGQFESAVERYVRARGYQFLNQAVEAPVVWTRIGECLVDWGYDLYRSNKLDEAREQFARVVAVAAGDGARSVPAGSPLYGHPVFALIEAAVPAYLADMEAEPPAPITVEMAVVLQRAAMYQDMLDAGLNVLGLPVDLVPVFRFRYLQPVARYFAEQAIKAEREYMSFLANSEQDTANQLQLRQSIDLAGATVKLEARRIEEARAELAVAEESRRLARRRTESAAARQAEYAGVSADRVALDTASAHASGGFGETEGGYRVALSDRGTVGLGDEDYEILRNAAWHRGMIQRQFELADMARTEAEYAAAEEVADGQVVLSSRRLGVAHENQAIAVLRRQQAQQVLDLAQSRTFDAQLWHALADRMRELARLYLDRAIEVAYMMQAAYNFETDAGLDKISANYGTAYQLNGLLGGNALLADVDYFAYHYVTQTRSKELPVKTVLSLAEFFPFALFQFRRTGVAHFETTADLFDMLYPGSYLHRIKAVEVVVEGVVPADGINGTFRNTGISAYRTRDGSAKTRLQPQETMLLSAYAVRGDAVVFRPSSEETRGIFEDSGVGTAWTLEIPPGSNDLRYQSISDVKVVLYHTAFHDPSLEERVRAALPPTGNWARSFSLRESRPDAFFLLLETGAASFDLDRGDFPFQQSAPRVERIAVYAVADTVAPRAGVAVDLGLGTVAPVRATTGADGTVSSGGGSALDAFAGRSPLGTWQVSLDAAANPALFAEDPPGSGVRRVKGLRDLVVTIDYEYTTRTSALD